MDTPTHHSVLQVTQDAVHSPEPTDAPPLGADDLRGVFERACRPDRSTHLVGTELEKFGIAIGSDGTVVPVNFHDHIAPAMAAMVERFGWAPGPDHGIDGETIMLVRDGASITLEPGGQFELSGKPLANVHETCAEFTEHYHELDEISRPLGLSWMTAGFHPWATRAEVPIMPKGRYAIMRQYLPTRGSRALDMMLRTSTVQANFDYVSETDCGRRLRIASAMSPVLTALFANSPYVEGSSAAIATARSRTWTEMDPDRCGIPRFVFDGAFEFQRYIDWALDVPMFFVKRGDRYVAHHASFRKFMADGLTTPDGVHHRATLDDWTTHMSTVFPEVRLKPYIEVRSADAVGSKYVCALPAVVKGVLYDDDAAEEVWESLRDLAYDERIALWHEANQKGLTSPRLQALAKTLLRASRGGLSRANILDSKGRDEARFLDPLDVLVERGHSPAHETLAALGESPGTSDEARRAFARAYYFAGTEV